MAQSHVRCILVTSCEFGNHNASSDLVGKPALSSRNAVQSCVSIALGFLFKAFAAIQIWVQTALNSTSFGSECLQTKQFLAQTACNSSSFGSEYLQQHSFWLKLLAAIQLSGLNFLHQYMVLMPTRVQDRRHTSSSCTDLPGLTTLQSHQVWFERCHET